MIEHEGKTYKRTDKELSLRGLRVEAGESPCPKMSIQNFIREFYKNDFIYYPGKEIPLLRGDIIKWVSRSNQAIPWLVEHGFLREAEKKTYYHVGQFFKWDGCILRLVSIGLSQVIMVHITDGEYFKGSRHSGSFSVNDRFKITTKEMASSLGDFPDDYTLIDPPLIVEQERRADKCVHNEDSLCKNSKAIKFFNFLRDTQCFHCRDKRFKDCPEYSETEGE
jgi:hypothetical protein